MAPTTFRARSFAALLAAAVVVVILDHITKWLVVAHLAVGAEWPVGGLIAIHHTENAGAAFSMLPNAQWLFLGVAVVVCTYILVAGHRFGATVYRQTVLGAVLGGALSNGIDRALHGYVVDFIDLRHFPVFNVADIAITCGILLAIVTFQSPKSATATTGASASGDAPS